MGLWYSKAKFEPDVSSQLSGLHTKIDRLQNALENERRDKAVQTDDVRTQKKNI